MKLFTKLSLLGVMALGAFAWAQADEITIYNATNTESCFPMHTNYFDTQGKSGQVIYPADQLSNLANKQISALTFYYSNESTVNLPADAVIDCRLFETDQTEFAGYQESNWISDGTSVYQGPLTATNGTITVPFTDGFNYGGNNLLVSFEVTTAGSSYCSTWFYGTPSGTVTCGFGRYGFSSFTTHTFYPKVTITYNNPTAINDVQAEKTVSGVTYVNLAGQTSVEPFSGVNIEVTKYNDGTTQTKKVVR